jgi:hypothetical protein
MKSSYMSADNQFLVSINNVAGVWLEFNCRIFVGVKLSLSPKELKFYG